MLYYAVLTLRESGHKAVYAAVERPLQFAQTAAIMEVSCFFSLPPFLFSSTLVVHFSLLCHSKDANLAQFHIFAQLMKSGPILIGLITALKFE